MADTKISALPASTTPLAGTEVLPIVQSSTTKQVSVSNMLGVTNWTSPAVNSEGNMFLRATDDLGTGIGAQIGLGGKYNASSYFPFGGISGRKENASNNNVAGYTDILTTTAGGALTARMRFNSTGDGTLLNGNLVIGTSGKGIDFSATPGTGTSELLNDYEEGTWTPVYLAETGTLGAITYENVQGRYVKIGRLVTVTGGLYTSAFAAGTGSGQLLISGLPFASGTGVTAGVVGDSRFFTLNNPTGCQISSGSTTVSLLYRTTANGGINDLQVSDASGGVPANLVYFTATYQV